MTLYSRRKLAGLLVETALASPAQVQKAIASVIAYMQFTKRGHELELLVLDVKKQALEHGFAEADVVTASPMTSQLQVLLEKMVKDRTNAREVRLHNHVDPSILGGTLVSLPASELDITIKRQLKQLELAVA